MSHQTTTVEAFDETSREGSPFRLRLVAHEPRAYDWFYNVVSNPTLWFIQHYLWDLKDEPSLDDGLHRAWTEGYEVVNRNFAAAVLEELDREPGATVFFHDYHLYLAPRHVRDARPDATLQHFVHIPWAQADYWHVLPLEIRQQIHEGILANDVVGFHTLRWSRSFLRCCEDFVGATCDDVRGTVEHGAAGGPSHREPDLRRRARVRRARGERRGARSGASARADADPRS